MKLENPFYHASVEAAHDIATVPIDSRGHVIDAADHLLREAVAAHLIPRPEEPGIKSKIGRIISRVNEWADKAGLPVEEEPITEESQLKRQEK